MDASTLGMAVAWGHAGHLHAKQAPHTVDAFKCAAAGQQLLSPDQSSGRLAFTATPLDTALVTVASAVNNGMAAVLSAGAEHPPAAGVKRPLSNDRSCPAQDPQPDTQPADDVSDPTAPKDGPTPSGSTTPAAALELRAALQGVPAELHVCANSNLGLYLVERRAVKCMCASCVEVRRDPRCSAYVVSPTEFERHSGIPAAKKWRFSIKVAHPGEPAISLGRWLEIKGLDHKLPKRGHGGSRSSPGNAIARQRQQLQQQLQQQQAALQALQGAAAAAGNGAAVAVPNTHHAAASAAKPLDEHCQQVAAAVLLAGGKPGDDQGAGGAAGAAAAAAADAARRLGLELSSGRADGVVQLTRVMLPTRKQQAGEDCGDGGALAEEAPGLAGAGAISGAAHDVLQVADMVAAEPPAALRQQRGIADATATAAVNCGQTTSGRPAPPRLDIVIEEDAGAAAVDEDPNDDSVWMQSPRKLRTPRAPNGAAAGAGVHTAPDGAATAPGAALGDEKPEKALEEEEEEGIRVGAEYQAVLPDWRPKPVLHGCGPEAQQAAAAVIASELARAGPRGPSEEEAIAIAVQEKARAESLPPDAIDDLWERREPALALERGQRQRRAPGWIQGEIYVHQLGGGGKGGRDDDDDGGNSSDHGAGSTRRARKRVSSTSAHSGSSAPPPPAAPASAAAAAAALMQQQQQLVQQLAAAQRARSTLSNASSGMVQMQHALVAAVAQPGVPHMVEWRTDEGRQSMDVAMVLGGQVYVGRLDSRGPLLNWLPPAPLQQVQAAAAPAAMAAAAAAAPVPAPVLPPVAAAAAAVQQVAQQARVAVKEEPVAAPTFDRPLSSDHPQRHCTLCEGGRDADLGPFMPVQIQNGQLEWVHRDCALWSPEVSVDSAGRLLSLAAAVRRGMETVCTHCNQRGATLPCWCIRSCGHELHLPCARKMGCHMSEGGDPHFDGRRLIACPAHNPAGPGFDPAAMRKELAARDAEFAHHRVAVAPAPGHGGALAHLAPQERTAVAAQERAQAVALAVAAVNEELEAAELLTGIKRGSLVGSGDSTHDHDHGGGAGAHDQGRRDGGGAGRGWPAAKRRRSTSGDGSVQQVGSEGTRDGGLSDDEIAGDGGDAGWGPKRRRLSCKGDPGAHGGGKQHAVAATTAMAAEVADGAAALSLDGEAVSNLLQRLRVLSSAGGAADAAARPSGVAGAGLLQQLQPALLGAGSGGFGMLLGAAGGGAPAPASGLGDVFGVGGMTLGGTTGQAGRPGRCAVCVIQRKGKCGTDSAPKRCIRRQAQLLEAQILEQKLRQQLAAQQDQLLLGQLQTAACQELGQQQVQQQQQHHHHHHAHQQQQHS